MWDQQDRTAAWMDALLELLAAGRIDPVIDAVFCLRRSRRRPTGAWRTA